MTARRRKAARRLAFPELKFPNSRQRKSIGVVALRAAHEVLVDNAVFDRHGISKKLTWKQFAQIMDDTELKARECADRKSDQLHVDILSPEEIQHVLASAIYACLTEESVELVHPFSEGATPLVAFAWWFTHDIIKSDLEFHQMNAEDFGAFKPEGKQRLFAIEGNSNAPG